MENDANDGEKNGSAAIKKKEAGTTPPL